MFLAELEPMLISTHRDQAHMQKSAHISSIATRLNNLEQKVDELDEPSGGGDNDADIERIVKNTFGSATDGRSTKWQENTYFFDGRTDISAMLWGAYFWNPVFYESCAQYSFYQQVIGHGYETKFGKETSSSLAATVFGSTTSDDFVDYFTRIGKSLAQSCFGTRGNLSDLNISLLDSLKDFQLSTEESLQALDENIQNLRSRVAALEARI